jgi:uncharacterized protein YukE
MATAGRFRLNLEALGSSATHVTGQGEDLATAHLSSDNRLVAAQSGWVGSSAAALDTKTAQWLETSRRLVTSIGDHAANLNRDGIVFSAMEREHAENCGRSLSPLMDKRVAAGVIEWR